MTRRRLQAFHLRNFPYLCRVPMFMLAVALVAGQLCAQQVVPNQSEYELPDPPIVQPYEANLPGESVHAMEGYTRNDAAWNPACNHACNEPCGGVCDCQTCNCQTDGFSPFSPGFITLDGPYTFQMLDFQNRQGDKEVILLNRSCHNGGQAGVTFGAQFRGSGLFAKTNTDNKFSYLGRFPTDFSGDSASDFRLLHANQNVTVDFNPAVHGYFETLFSDVFSFPDFKQGSFQVRQAYVVFGDFARSPFYAYLGKKNVSFGDMSTLSPFSQAMPWHYFGALAEGAGIGFNNQRLNATVSALNGGRGIRVVDSDEKGHLNNFAANVLLRTPLDRFSQLDIGAGFLHGTIYDASVAEHLDPTLFGPNNAAFDVNAKLRLANLQLAGEYVQTVDPWPATGHEVIAYRAEAAYDMSYAGMPARSSVSWSEGIQGAAGTEFEFNRQLVIGLAVQPYPNTLFTFEYVRSSGFAPLIHIQHVSDKDVVQDSFVFGAVMSL